MRCHSESDLHYIHVFRPVDTFAEIRACYALAAKRLGWMSVDDLSLWNHLRPEWQDPEAMPIFWGELPRIPKQRRALFGFRYTESAGERASLIRGQQIRLKSFISVAGLPEIVFAGSPAARRFLDPFCRRTGVMPAGYDPEVMGQPDWSRPKDFDLSFYGSGAGRRAWILKAVETRLGARFLRIVGFAGVRKALLDRCRAVLYVGHSDETSFPGMRLWQAAAASAALVSEERDPWPAIPGTHLISIPAAIEASPDAFLASLETVLKGDLESVARAAHQELSRWTVERCMEEFMVPQTARLRSA